MFCPKKMLRHFKVFAIAFFKKVMQGEFLIRKQDAFGQSPNLLFGLCPNALQIIDLQCKTKEHRESEAGRKEECTLYSIEHHALANKIGRIAGRNKGIKKGMYLHIP